MGSNLARLANQIRLKGLVMSHNSKSGHLGGAFSMAEILSVLYFHEMNVRPDQPDWPERDRLVLSKGHGTVALYPTLAIRSFFPEDRLAEFRRIDGELSGHASIQVPGVDASTGSLGQGISVGVGIALAGKLDRKNYYTYVICGDGELQEGQVWEAATFAPNHELDHLIVIVDNNKLQLDGETCSIANIRDIGLKFSSFGWNVIDSVDGHNCDCLIEAFNMAKKSCGQPTVIIAETVKGKGVSFMENNCAYHGKQPDAKHYDIAYRELQDLLDES